MEQIRALSRRYELVAPHVPVAGRSCGFRVPRTA
jgi:hypothetical protein